MDEKDYIIASDLAILRIAKQVLRELTPGVGHIDKASSQKIFAILNKWIEKYEKDLHKDD